MDESAYPNQPFAGTPAPDVAQMLRSLDLQAAALRARRGSVAHPLQSGSFRYGSLIAIGIFAFGSLGLLEWFLSQVPRPAHPVNSFPPALSAPGPSALTAGTSPYRN